MFLTNALKYANKVTSRKNYLNFNRVETYFLIYDIYTSYASILEKFNTLFSN